MEHVYDADAPSAFLFPHSYPAIANLVLDPVAAKDLTPNGLMFVNRRVDTIERDLHQLGHKFIIDRSGETLSPADCTPNRPPTEAMLAGLARPDQPPRMFGN